MKLSVPVRLREWINRWNTKSKQQRRGLEKDVIYISGHSEKTNDKSTQRSCTIKIYLINKEQNFLHMPQTEASKMIWQSLENSRENETEGDTERKISWWWKKKAGDLILNSK